MSAAARGGRPPGAVHVISLDRTPERWSHFQADNPGIAMERFAAVDGRAAPLVALVEAGLADAGLGYTPGAFGCALSHAALWRRCVESGDALTVCEDDAILRPDFAAAAAATAAQVDGAELILWGWNFDSVLAGRLFGETPFAMGFDQARMRGSIDRFREDRVQPTLLRLHRALGTVCYTVTPRGAQVLLARCFPLRPESVFIPLLDRDLPNTGVDIAMNAAYPEMAAYVAFPPLALTRNDALASTVEGI
ncbi:MAG: glycosyltransferase family 25 protein [Caulobacteraceae bacterium]